MEHEKRDGRMAGHHQTLKVHVTENVLDPRERRTSNYVYIKNKRTETKTKRTSREEHKILHDENTITNYYTGFTLVA